MSSLSDYDQLYHRVREMSSYDRRRRKGVVGKGKVVVGKAIDVVGEGWAVVSKPISVVGKV